MDDNAIYLVVVIFATILQVGGSAKCLAWRRHSGDVADFTLPAFAGSCGPRRSWPAAAPRCSRLGKGLGWGLPPLGLLAGGLGWQAGLRWPTSLSPPCARRPSPPLPPPPGLPLRPLHGLVRALTCEIKRDFNYLSAKQQLERITAQQQSPPPLPPPDLSPLFLQPPPRL